MKEVDKEIYRRLSELAQNQALASGDKDELDGSINIKLQAVTLAP